MRMLHTTTRYASLCALCGPWYTYPMQGESVPPALSQFMGKVAAEIINPAIGLIFAAALVYFLWGVFTFFLSVSADAKKTEGKSHMLWGIVGMAVMVAVYGLITLVRNTVGV